MKKTSKILCAALAICMFLAIASVAATETLKTIQVSENIKVTIDGGEFKPKDGAGNAIKPFVYNGVAYVPMSAFANALGYNATYDSKTSSTNITKKVETKAPVTTPVTTPSIPTKEDGVYEIGEKWTVKDQWEFTVDSVKTHTLCNSYSDKNDMAQCVIITYTYKNLGYKGKAMDLYMSSVSFDVYDAEGEAAETYPCTHEKSAKELVVGTKCTGAQEAYALYNKSDYITLIVSKYPSNDTGEQTATFKLKVSK